MVPASASAQLMKVPVKPMSPSNEEEWVPGRAKRGACVDASRIAGAEVMDQRTVDIVLRGGERWRLRLDRECSHLTFYGGFYYSQAQSGQICAGRDRIIGRAGGDCRVQAVMPLKLRRR